MGEIGQPITYHSPGQETALPSPTDPALSVTHGYKKGCEKLGDEGA